jgi:hypothetical protein
MASGETIRDWSYGEARRRFREAAATHLPQHLAAMELDRDANRIVKCSCGWTGNGIGWLAHIDSVLAGAMRD